MQVTGTMHLLVQPGHWPAARAVEFGLCDWPDVLDILRDAGPDVLIRQVRGAEASDPEATRWPRNKSSDDATAAYLTALWVLR